jgi:predicted Fe-S protein YdhL (DUF1289 family)
MDLAGKYCQGCRRTTVEIGLWESMTEVQRIEVLADLPLRALGRGASQQPTSGRS